MSAYVIVDSNVLDQDKLASYKAQAAQTVKDHGGEFLVSGEIHNLNGSNNFKKKTIIKFPSREAVLKWYHSEEYQKLISNRNEALDSRFDLIS